MSKLAALPSVDVISGFRGAIDYYVTMGIPVARRWPRKKRHPPTPGEKAQWPIFADAVSLWNTLTEEVQDAYRKMASGSTLSGRDMMVKMYINAKSILPY